MVNRTRPASGRAKLIVVEGLNGFGVAGSSSSASGAAPRTVAQWVAGQLLPALKERDQTLAATSVTPRRLAELIQMAERGEVNANAAREVFERFFESDRTAAQIVDGGGFRLVTDAAELEAIVEQTLAANPRAVADLLSGKKQAAGFLVGQAMRASGGKADPKVIRKILDARLRCAP